MTSVEVWPGELIQMWEWFYNSQISKAKNAALYEITDHKSTYNSVAI